MPTTDPPIIWQPTEKQREFLSATEQEVLYGGAAGGGKSDALIIDALGIQQNAYANPGYRAVMFRRSLPELRDIISRSQELYPMAITGARYKESTKEWHFPSGAIVEYAYLEKDSDRFRYQGREFQWIGFDELTQWGSDVAYRYMLTRLRSTDESITCYQRASCNPGGIGHHWVQDYFGIPDTGHASCRVHTDEDGRVIKRRFIPARLEDNPHLAKTDYRSRLLQLSTMERRALLDGRWDVFDVEGAVYKEELMQAHLEGRICELPIDPAIPVNTFWDLGSSTGNATTIWFHQRVGVKDYFIDYEHAEGRGLAHFIKILQDKGYTYGTHYLPHDVNNKQQGLILQSRLQTLEDSGLAGRFIVVDRIQDLNDGINITRRAFSRSWFDKTRCADGLKALQSYRYQYDENTQAFKTKPYHDWASNAADAYRQYAQGYRPLTIAPRRKRRGSPMAA